MTAEELRELAYSTDEMDAFAVARAADYLRACADALDAGPVAWMDPLWIDHGGWPGESFHGAPVDGWVGLYPLAMPAPAPASDLSEGQYRDMLDAESAPYPVAMPAQLALRLPGPMTDEAVEVYGRRALMGHMSVRELIRAIEAETLRRVKECNE
jgi:hypothetical protein